MLNHKLARMAGSALLIISCQVTAADEANIPAKGINSPNALQPSKEPAQAAPQPSTIPQPASTAQQPVAPQPAATPTPIQAPVNTGISQLPNFQNLDFNALSTQITNAIDRGNDAIHNAVQRPVSWDNTIQPVLEQVATIKSLWNLLIILNNVAKTDQTTATTNSLLPKISAFHGKLLHNLEYYVALNNLKNAKDFAQLSATQQLFVQQTLQDYKLNGAELNTAQQQRYVKIILRLRELADKYLSNLSAATNSWQFFIPKQDEVRLAGIPDFIVEQAAAKAQAAGKNGWILTLDDSCLVAVETYAKDRKLRETLYNAFAVLASAQTHDPERKHWDNTAIVAETLQLRQELATLLRFDNFAAYASADRQPPDPAQAMEFLHDLALKIKPAASKELASLQDFAKLDKLDKLQAWDIAYYGQWDKAMVAAGSQAKSKEYFRTTSVLQGLFNLASILFNIEIAEVKDASTWNKDVKLYSVSDVQNKIIGYFYLDLYARDGKDTTDKTLIYLSKLHMKEDLAPVTVISTNIRTNIGLISHYDAVRVFAQFGEMLQRTLAVFDYPNLSSTTGMTWDAIALSNQYMQNWAWQKEFLQDFASQYKTGAKLPDDVFNALLAANNFDAEIDLLQQLQLAIFDLRVHLNLPEDKNKSALDIFYDIRKQYEILPTVPVDDLPNRFSETFTTEFAGTYYSYYWDKMLAADAFAAFTENGLFSAKIGHKFRDTLLEQGGQASVSDLFAKFRGRPPQTKFMLLQAGIGS